MRKDKILKEFLTLNCIKNQEALNDYIDFCIEHDVGKKISGQTSSHHILPCAKTLPFASFINFNICPWNKSELTYSDHYKAHYLLTLAIDHLAVLHSFCKMHKTDIKNNRLNISDLIDPKIYDILFLERNKKISQHRLEIMEVNGEKMTKAALWQKQRVISPALRKKFSDQMSGKNNIVYKSGVVEKIRRTKSTKTIDGKNMDRISAERAAKTMKQPFITTTGEETTIYKQSAKKHSQTLKRSFIDSDGNKITLADKYGKERSIRMRNKGKWYLLKNIFDLSFSKTISAVEARQISPGLEKCTKEKYLGYSKFGQTILTKRNKSHLIGLYVERL